MQVHCGVPEAILEVAISVRDTVRILILLLLLGVVAPAMSSCCSGKGKASVSGCGSHETAQVACDPDAPARTCCRGSSHAEKPGEAVDHHTGGGGHDPAQCQSSGKCQGRCGCPCFTLQTTPFLGVRPLPLVTPEVRRVALPVRDARLPEGHPDSILHPPSLILYA